MRFLLTALLVFCGCAARQLPVRTMPPLPWDRVYVPSPVSRVAKLLEAPPETVTVSWSCPKTPWATNYITGLEASADLQTWTEVSRLPYQPQSSVTLTNRPGVEFYRAFNTIAP